jgi:hypothetical protein
MLRFALSRHLRRLAYSGGYTVRKSHFTLLGIALLAGGTILPAAGPAMAAGTGSTTTTFSIVSGSLAISVPATASLGSVASGATVITALLGNVQVVDARASTAGSWTATVSSSSFLTGGGTPAETVPSSDVFYDAGQAIATSGTGTFTPGTPAALTAAVTAFSASSEVGSTSVTWDPQITIQIPAAAVSGTYTGTITHSVA